MYFVLFMVQAFSWRLGMKNYKFVTGEK